MTEQTIRTYFDELYDTTQEKILTYIIAKCGKTEDIEDIFMETYTEVISVIHKRGIEYIENPEAFVMELAKRKIYRHYKLSQRISQLIGKHNYEEDGLEEVEYEKVTFDEDIMNHLTAGKAMEYLSKKDELTKKIFHLHYYMDKTLKEIAELLSINESNVKNRLYRTLKELREYLTAEGMV